MHSLSFIIMPNIKQLSEFTGGILFSVLCVLYVTYNLYNTLDCVYINYVLCSFSCVNTYSQLRFKMSQCTVIYSTADFVARRDTSLQLPYLFFTKVSISLMSLYLKLYILLTGAAFLQLSFWYDLQTAFTLHKLAYLL